MMGDAPGNETEGYGTPRYFQEHPPERGTGCRGKICCPRISADYAEMTGLPCRVIAEL